MAEIDIATVIKATEQALGAAGYARDVLEFAAPLLEKAVREEVAREILAASIDRWRNLAWMYPEQAAAVALGNVDAADRGHHVSAEFLRGVLGELYREPNGGAA